jgi:hypothetical protein
MNISAFYLLASSASSDLKLLSRYDVNNIPSPLNLKLLLFLSSWFRPSGYISKFPALHVIVRPNRVVVNDQGCLPDLFLKVTSNVQYR